MFIFPVLIQQTIFNQDDTHSTSQPQSELINQPIQSDDHLYQFNKYSSLKQFTDNLDEHDLQSIKTAGYVCNNTIMMAILQNVEKEQPIYSNYKHLQEYIQICQKVNEYVRQGLQSELKVDLDLASIEQQFKEESELFDKSQSK